MFLLKLSCRPWRLAPFSQAFTALSVGFLLFLSGALYWLDRGLKPVQVRLQLEQVLTAYIDPSFGVPESNRVVDSIKSLLGASPLRAATPAEVKYMGPHQFAEELKKYYPDLSEQLEDLGEDMGNVIPKYVLVTGMLPGNAAERIKGITGVETVESSKGRYESVVGVIRTLRWFAKILIAGLALAILTGLIHLIRMNTQLFSETVHSFRLLGASAWMLKTPAMVSSVWIGFLGGLIAFITFRVTGNWLARESQSLALILKDMPLPPSSLSTQLLCFGILFGAIAGWFAGARNVQGA